MTQPPSNASDPSAAGHARPSAAVRFGIPLLAVGVAAVFTLVVLLLARLDGDGARRVRLFGPGSGAFRGFALPEPFAAAPIDLATADGGRFTLDGVRGRPVLLFFGYTRCPDVCPQTLAKLTAALGALGDAADGVTVVFATVDPAHDTAAVVDAYLADYDDRIVGLVGTAAELARLAADYDVAYGTPPPAPSGAADGAASGAAPHDDGHGDAHAHGAPGAGGTAAAPALGHSSTVFLIDAEGQVRVVLGAEATPDDIAHDVRALDGAPGEG